MLLHVHPLNPQPRQIKTIIDCLKSGGIIIYPTDNIYGLGCDITNQKAIEKIDRMLGDPCHRPARVCRFVPDQCPDGVVAIIFRPRHTYPCRERRLRPEARPGDPLVVILRIHLRVVAGS